MSKIDLDILDDLIGKCESSIASPFAKKKEPEKEDNDPRSDLSDEEVEMLSGLYSDIKE